MKILWNTILLISFSSIAHAGCESILEKHIGWTIIASKTIEGYRDSGEEKKDDFEGCEYDRIVYFMDGTKVTCNSYGYQYAYMPKAILLGKSTTYKGKDLTIFKMIVNSNVYDVH